jgi:hypothetical protein
VLSALIIAVLSNSGGVSGYSGGPPNHQTCNDCHSGGAAPTVTLTGPTTLTAGQTANYTLTVSGGAGARAGMDVMVDESQAKLNPMGANMGLDFGEVHQTSPASFSGGSATFAFSLTAPPFAATLTLYGAGNSVNGDGSTGGDRASTTTLAVTVTGGSGMNPPVITTPPAAAQNPVTGRTVALTVAANDDGTEANLSYTWSATGPAPVVFTPNGSNAAKASTAAFTEPGDYTLTITVLDGTNRSVTQTLDVNVVSTYTYLRLTPVSAQVAPGGMLQYDCTQRDQFDQPVPNPMTVTFDVPAGGGTINAAGLLHAQANPGGPFVVTASAGNITTSSALGVGQAPPAPADHNPPTVALVAPNTGGIELIDGLIFEATASDDTGVAEVWFEVAQVKVGASITSAPWQLTYATVAGLPGGTQTLVAVAKDIAGNISRSNALPVEVPAPPDAGPMGGGAGGGSAGGGSGGGGADANGGGTTVVAPDGAVTGSCASVPGAAAFLWILALSAWVRRGKSCSRQ